MKRVAICIGINTYTHYHDLKGAVEDATNMHKMLLRCSFDKRSKILISPDDNQILAVVKKVCALLEDGDQFLFYVASHGLTYNNDIFILAPQAEKEGLYIQNKKHIIPLSKIISILSAKPKTDQIYIVDACRTEFCSPYRNGMTKETISFSEEYLRDFIEPQVYEAAHETRIYSCMKSHSAREINQLKQGLFTYSMLEIMQQKTESIALNDAFVDEIKKKMEEVCIQYNLADTQFPTYIREGKLITIPAPQHPLSPTKKPKRTPSRVRPQVSVQERDPPLIQLVRVEGGSFVMGYSGSSVEDIPESPTSRVTLSPFYIGIHPVTQQVYRQIITHYNPLEFIGDTRPVHSVNWYQAIDFCNKLSIREDLEPVYICTGMHIMCNWEKNGYRLPTEAEWEYAAKGGNTQADFRYAGSHSLEEVGIFSSPCPSEVCMRKPNALGLYDMSGNIWEWCWDTYAPYTSEDKRDPRSTLKGTIRVLRGGAWYNKESYCTTTYRCPENISTKNAHIGFRVVRQCVSEQVY